MLASMSTPTCQCGHTSWGRQVFRQIRTIRRSVTRPVLESLVMSLVLLPLDYGSATLAGLPIHAASRQTSVGTECCSSTDLERQLCHCPHHVAPSQSIWYCVKTKKVRFMSTLLTDNANILVFASSGSSRNSRGSPWSRALNDLGYMYLLTVGLSIQTIYIILYNLPNFQIDLVDLEFSYSIVLLSLLS